MFSFRSILLAVAILTASGVSAFAEKRVALVIGNSGYQNVARLSNPANDAAAMTETLKGAAFDIIETRRDLKIAEMRRVFRDFANSSRDADVAVVYYAGHGIEVEGTNYLIPIDASLEQDLDVYDEAFALDRVLVTIEPAKQLRLVILDACRDNPFAKTMKRTIGSRAVGRGLAKVEPSSPNTLIAFASKAGSTASDGDSKNSPFTAALVKHIAKPGLDLRKAFGFVRDDVLKNTSNRQEPYVYGSLGGEDVPLVPAKPVVAAPTPNPNAEVRRDYELALQIGTREVWTAFLAQYPDGLYASLAKGQLNKIASEEARVTATQKAGLAEEEKARLRAEGAKQAEQAKAAAQAKTAEEARITAERAKQIEQEKVAAAEHARAAAEKLAAERLAAQKAVAEKVAAEKAEAAKAVEDKLAAEKAAAEAAKPEQKSGQQVASLPPTNGPETKPVLSPVEVARLLQSELRRVGCSSGSIDGNWDATSQQTLGLFNKHAGTKLDVKVANLDALDAVRSKPARICPLICSNGYKPNGDHCVKIGCDPGFVLNDNNECAKKHETPPREERATKRNKPKPVQVQTEPSAPGSYDPYDRNRKITVGGLRTCGENGCQIVPKGCHAIRGMGGGGLGGKIICP
jgi:hypothetical protein